MGPLIQQSTGYEKQPHININGVLKIALKASFWVLYLFGASIYSWILKYPHRGLRDYILRLTNSSDKDANLYNQYQFVE